MRRAVLLLLAVLALLATGLPGAAAADDAAAGWRADRALVVGVPGLLWSDLDPDRTPALWELAETSPMGAVSVRAARSTTCLLDGWATLGAGNRARFPAPDEALPQVPVPTVPLPGEEPGEAGTTPTPGPVPAGPPASPELSFCGLQERLAQVGLADPLTAVRAVAEDQATARFGAEPAVLGAAVGCATVVGRAPVVAAAAPGVGLNRLEQLPGDPAAVAALLEPCPLTLVSLDGLVDAGVPADGSETGTEPRSREAALADVDAAVAALRAAVATLPGDTLLLLQGVSEVNDGRPQLHVGLASGPGFTGPGWLTSASTGRAPYTQLIDVAPTVLRALGLERPASVNGQPLTVTGEHPGTAEAVATLVRANTAAVTHHRSTGTFYAVLVAVDAAVVALGLLVLGVRRGAPVRPSRARLRPVLTVAALAAAALPVATYLAGLVPWERAGSPRWALAGAVLLADAAVLALAVLGPWRRSRTGPLLAVLGVTGATLAADVLTGSTLELDGLLGYDPIVAGRFTGYGNLTAGLLAGAALPVTAALAAAAGRRAGRGRDDGGRRRRRVTGAVVLAAGAVTVVLVGTPGLGRDFGGVLALLPGFLLLAMLLTGVRVTVVRLAAVLAAGVVAVGTLAVLDWLRPADDRSHLGRFVEQLLTGEAWTVVSRKGQANLDILVGSSLSWALPVALVAAVWLVRRPGLPRGAGPGLLRAGGSGLPPADTAVLRAGLLAAALSLALGAAVNDSGVALPATAAALLVPLLVALAARAPRRGADAEAQGPGEGDDRVTVGSRGSTWNT
ncbi:hypothetical protein SAMN05660690_3636 [Geodermatophilus telluris]|uniref:Phosphoglyceromutase n=1 Tax=Geodermatophilus telluris TaxID=1190417 RepID=A0A1G6SV15_9ACTN|nr:hypothetical protein [Geodermatophilus telluris]SDD20638.1 hypothetical protein SAMN05660690_3636 [Geodermatophilus telluris]